MLQLNQGKFVDIVYKTIGRRIQIRLRSSVGSYSICIGLCPILVSILRYQYHLRFNLIYVSKSLCISPHEQCVPKSVGTDSQEAVTVKNSDKKVCNFYLDGAINVMQKLQLPYQPEMIDNLRVSCLHDLITTNDATVGKKFENLLIMCLQKEFNIETQCSV